MVSPGQITHKSRAFATRAFLRATYLHDSHCVRRAAEKSVRVRNRDSVNSDVWESYKEEEWDIREPEIRTRYVKTSGAVLAPRSARGRRADPRATVTVAPFHSRQLPIRVLNHAHRHRIKSEHYECHFHENRVGGQNGIYNGTLTRKKRFTLSSPTFRAWMHEHSAFYFSQDLMNVRLWEFRAVGFPASCRRILKIPSDFEGDDTGTDTIQGLILFGASFTTFPPARTAR